MPIFGQVWLWSSLAFLLGALLCWLLVAYPARKRVRELENELAARARRQQPERSPSQESARRATNEMEEDFARAMVPGLGDHFADDQSEYLTRAYALRDVPDAEPPRPAFPDPTRAAAATQYLNVADTSLPEPPRQRLEAPPEVPVAPPPPSDRGWFDDELRGKTAEHDQLADQPTQFTEPAYFSEPVLPGRLTESDLPAPGSLDARLVDDEADEPTPDEPRSAIEDDQAMSGGTIFTQQTRPIPAELIRQIDTNTSEDTALVDDLADEPVEAGPQDHTVESEPVPAPATPAAFAEAPADEPTGVSNGATPPLPPVTSRPEPAGEPTEIVPAVTPTASEPVRREEYVITPGVAVQVEQTPSKLPKRVPSKPQHRTPFAVQTEDPEPTATAPAAAESSVSEPTRSLFEPIVPAGDATAVPPPPHRVREGTNGQPTRGPFGPGSAMPLPGGASPSPDFTIKASVAALRYCTPDSPQFGRTVAEVWFRSAADAERVGFRPVG